MASAVGLLVALAGCADSGEWRTVQPDGWALEAAMPCRPAKNARTLTLAGRQVAWSLWSCESDGQLVALGSGDLTDPVAVPDALRQLPQSAARNLGATVQVQGPVAVPGMTPYEDAVRYRIEGRGPDGVLRAVEGAVFARGTRVYQAMLMGPGVDARRAAPLLEALRLRAP
jgi:hypothetical protein